jgi:hypothetical protein
VLLLLLLSSSRQCCCCPMPALTPCDPMHRGFPPGRAAPPGVCYRACIGSRQARTFDFEIAQGAYCLLLIACCLLRRRRHSRKGLQKPKAEGVVSSSTCCVYSVQAQRTAYRCWFIGCWMLATCRCRVSSFEVRKIQKAKRDTADLWLAAGRTSLRLRPKAPLSQSLWGSRCVCA